MTGNDELRRKVSGALKGFFNSCEFVTPQYSSKASWSMYYVYIRENLCELQYNQRKYEQVLRFIGEYFKNRVDRTLTAQCLKQSAHDWLESPNSLSDATQFNLTLDKLLNKISEKITTSELYIPIMGIELLCSQSLKLGECELLSSAYHQDFSRIIQKYIEQVAAEEDKSDFVTFGGSPTFLKLSINAHSKQAVQDARGKAELSLAILRLFLCSYYSHIHNRDVPKVMGLSGTLPAGGHGDVFSIYADFDLADQVPGWSVKFKNYESFQINKQNIDALKNLGLERISQLLSTEENTNKSSLSSRLSRVISWFSKATVADSISDSYLMYAIAVESLLSEGRTPKDVYADRIAGLVTRIEDIRLFPPGNLISKAFNDELANKSQSQRFSVVQSRVIELFNLRNLIVHGNNSGNDINPYDLLDFETLVRGSILSFIIGNWDSLEEYKSWLDGSINTIFLQTAS